MSAGTTVHLDFHDGVVVGIQMVLDQLEGKGVEGPRVEMTQDLSEWITFARARLDQLRAAAIRRGGE